MVQVVVDRLQDRVHQVLAQAFPLLIDIHVASPREIDPLERAGPVLLGLDDLACPPLPFLINKQRLAPVQFPDVLRVNIHDRLDDRTLGGEHDHLVVGIIKGGTYAPGIPDAEHLATTRDATDHETAVPRRDASPEHVREIDPVLNGMGDVHACQSLALAIPEQTLHLAIQPVADLLEHDISIRILPRMLPRRGDLLEDLIDICQVEIAAKRQVLGPPIIAAQERMNIRDAGLAGRAVTKMSHIELACERKIGFGEERIIQLLW